MIPFVVAGGILLALSVPLSGKSAVPSSGILGDLATIWYHRSGPHDTDHIRLYCVFDG